MFHKLWVSLLILVWVSSLFIPVTAQDASCDEVTIRANLQRVIDEGFNQGNAAVVDEVFSEAYVSHPDELDREGFRSQMLALRTAIPSGNARIDHVLVEGCDAFFIFHQGGLMEGELTFPGDEPIPATGGDLKLDAHIYLRFNEQGQIVEEWDYVDNFSFLTQLGVIPMPEGAPADQEMAEALEAPMMPETIITSGNEARNTENVLRAFEEGFNASNWDLVRGLYAPDYAAADDPQSGIEELIGIMTAFRNAMQDGAITVHDTVVQGDYVAARVTLAGTFQSDLVFPDEEPIPATGQPLSLELSFLHRLTPDGLIVEDWTLFDFLGFAEQTGMMQPEAPAEAG